MESRPARFFRHAIRSGATREVTARRAAATAIGMAGRSGSFGSPKISRQWYFGTPLGPRGPLSEARGQFPYQLGGGYFLAAARILAGP
jgi:hypothetical protein